MCPLTQYESEDECNIARKKRQVSEPSSAYTSTSPYSAKRLTEVKCIASAAERHYSAHENKQSKPTLSHEILE